jgi:hypothetical protein
MTFLKRLAAGDIALWRVFWLIGTPLALVWDLTGAAMVFGTGATGPVLTAAIIAIFTLATLALPFVAFATWRSATNYPRGTWSRTALAWAAKVAAVVSGLIGLGSIVGLIYLVRLFLEAVFAPY